MLLPVLLAVVPLPAVPPALPTMPPANDDTKEVVMLADTDMATVAVTATPVE